MDYNNHNSTNEKVKTIQINLHISMSASSTLSQYMNERNIDLALVQELYLIDNKVAIFPLKYQIVQYNNKSKSAIIINSYKIKVMVLHKNTCDLIVWAIVELIIKAYICALYIWRLQFLFVTY